jgi:hypothetical protein
MGGLGLEIFAYGAIRYQISVGWTGDLNSTLAAGNESLTTAASIALFAIAAVQLGAEASKAWSNLRAMGTWGPNRAVGTPLGHMAEAEDGLVIMNPSGGRIGNLNSSIPIGKPSNPASGTQGESSTRGLWTVDQRGANFLLENQAWDSDRGIPTHVNISTQAYSGGEFWRTGTDKITISSASRAFGYNDKLSSVDHETA